jgi:glycosyltransferase involved in cell wall biosynthesis
VPGILKKVVNTHAIDVICDDLNKIPFYSPWLVKRPVVAIVHHLFRKTIYHETNPVLATYVFGTESIIPLCYHDIPFVAVSKSTAQDLIAMGVHSRNIHVVYNGIPVRRDITAQQRQKDLIVYVGRIKKYKSIDHFLQAVSLLREIRDVQIMVVGDGDALEGLKATARELDLEVEFTGFVSEDEKYRIYARARMAVQPSIKEGWGLTALEAQSCGTPVVCADSPGLREAVVDGKTGFVYPYGDIERFTNRMECLLDDDALWGRFSNQAQEWAQQFSWDAAALQFEEILGHTVQEGNHG